MCVCTFSCGGMGKYTYNKQGYGGGVEKQPKQTAVESKVKQLIFSANTFSIAQIKTSLMEKVPC